MRAALAGGRRAHRSFACLQRRPELLDEFVRILGEEAGAYRDPVTDFLLSVYVEFDFETAREKLNQCGESAA